MRTIGDMEHFALGEGETLILRYTKHVSEQTMAEVRAAIEKGLPGAPVLVLPPEVEVCAGKIEVYGAQLPVEDEEQTRERIRHAYDEGHMVYASFNGENWFYVHRVANPHTFDWGRYSYSLTNPQRRR